MLSNDRLPLFAMHQLLVFNPHYFMLSSTRHALPSDAECYRRQWLAELYNNLLLLLLLLLKHSLHVTAINNVSLLFFRELQAPYRPAPALQRS